MNRVGKFIGLRPWILGLFGAVIAAGGGWGLVHVQRELAAMPNEPVPMAAAEGMARAGRTGNWVALSDLSVRCEAEIPHHGHSWYLPAVAPDGHVVVLSYSREPSCAEVEHAVLSGSLEVAPPQLLRTLDEAGLDVSAYSQQTPVYALWTGYSAGEMQLGLAACALVVLLGLAMYPLGLFGRRDVLRELARDAEARRVAAEVGRADAAADASSDVQPSASTGGPVDAALLPNLRIRRIPRATKARVFADGIELGQSSPNEYPIPLKNGEVRLATLLVPGWDLAEKLSFDGHVLTIVPPLRPRDIAFAMFPLTLGFAGGAAGGGLGLVAAMANVQIMRTKKPAWVRFALSLGCGAIACAGWLLIAWGVA